MTVDDGPGEGGVENLLHTDLIPWSPPARGWSLISEVAQCRLALRVEPALHAREVAHARRMDKVVWYWPDAREYREEMRCCIGQCLFDVLRRRWPLAPRYRRMDVEKRADEYFKAVVERRDANQPVLKPHEVVTKQVAAVGWASACRVSSCGPREEGWAA
jgi:hypothetical protein